LPIRKLDLGEIIGNIILSNVVFNRPTINKDLYGELSESWIRKCFNEALVVKMLSAVKEWNKDKIGFKVPSIEIVNILSLYSPYARGFGQSFKASLIM
jgi:hypothetical protein